MSTPFAYMQSLRMALNPGIPPFTGGDDTTLTNAEYGSPHSEYEVSMMMADADRKAMVSTMHF